VTEYPPDSPDRYAAALLAISVLDGSREWCRSVARAATSGEYHPAIDGPRKEPT
jgi:hypothetical protein